MRVTVCQSCRSSSTQYKICESDPRPDGNRSLRFRVLTVIRPPSGMASRAFSTRLSRICWTCAGSIFTWPRSGGQGGAKDDISTDQADQQVFDSGNYVVQYEHMRFVGGGRATASS